MQSPGARRRGRARVDRRQEARPAGRRGRLALLDLYYSEGRNDELRRLALRLHRIEPHPGDRVRLLLEAMRPTPSRSPRPA